MQALKILTEAEWARLRDTGAFAGAPVDVTDGYIHLSTKEQVADTLAKHFAGHTGLVLVAVELDEDADDVRWELAPSRGEKFPHLYRELRMSDVVWAEAIGDDADGMPHVLPPMDGSGSLLPHEG